jgi:hypothetical protein
MQTLTNKFIVLATALAFSLGAALTAFAYDDLEIEVEVYSDRIEVEVEYDVDGEEMEEEYEYDTTDLDEAYGLLAVELGLNQQEVEDAVVKVEEEEEEEEEEENEESDMEEAADEIADAEEAILEAEVCIAEMEEGSDEMSEAEDKLANAEALLADAETAFGEADYETAEEKAELAEDLAKEICGEEAVDEEDEDNGDFCDKTKKAAGWGVAKKCVDDDDYKINDKMADKIERFADFGKSNDRAVLQSQLQQLLLILIDLLQQQMSLQSGQ